MSSSKTETATYLVLSQAPHSAVFSNPHATRDAGAEVQDSQMVLMLAIWVGGLYSVQGDASVSCFITSTTRRVQKKRKRDVAKGEAKRKKAPRGFRAGRFHRSFQGVTKSGKQRDAEKNKRAFHEKPIDARFSTRNYTQRLGFPFYLSRYVPKVSNVPLTNVR